MTSLSHYIQSIGSHYSRLLDVVKSQFYNDEYQDSTDCLMNAVALSILCFGEERTQKIWETIWNTNSRIIYRLGPYFVPLDNLVGLASIEAISLLGRYLLVVNNDFPLNRMILNRLKVEIMKNAIAITPERSAAYLVIIDHCEELYHAFIIEQSFGPQGSIFRIYQSWKSVMELSEIVCVNDEEINTYLDTLTFILDDSPLRREMSPLLLASYHRFCFGTPIIPPNAVVFDPTNNLLNGFSLRFFGGLFSSSESRERCNEIYFPGLNRSN